MKNVSLSRKIRTFGFSSDSYEDIKKKYVGKVSGGYRNKRTKRNQTKRNKTKRKKKKSNQNKKN